MKKKILLFVAILAMLCCLLAISVSATEIDYNEVATLSDNTQLPIYDENHNALVWFILSTDENGVNTYASVPTNRNKADNATSYINFNINSKYSDNQLHDVTIYYWDATNSKYVTYGEGTTVVLNLRDLFFWYAGTYTSNNLQYLYFPASAKGSGSYKNYTNLQLVDYSLCTEFSGFGEQAFWGCTSLKTVRLPQTGSYELSCKYSHLFDNCAIEVLDIPDCVTGIGVEAFANCKNLTKVNISENSKIVYMSDGSFKNCTSLTAFYLPPLLERIGYSSNGGSGTFSGCTNLFFVNNPTDTVKPDVYYFPTNFGKPLEDGTLTIPRQGFIDMPLSETVVLGEYFTKLYVNTFSTTAVKNVVCLGKMVNIDYASGKNPTIYLCNEELTSTDGITLENKSRYTVVVCNAQDNDTHLKEKTMSTDATCENPKMTADYCFCGAVISGTETTDGNALGHSYENGATSYVFTSLTEAGKKCVACTRNCGTTEDTALNPVFTNKGYSVKGYGEGIYFAGGYSIDQASLSLYEKEKNVDIDFGFAFNKAEGFTTGNVSLDSFKLKVPIAQETTKDGVKFDAYDFIIKYGDDSTHLDSQLIVAAYVIEKSESGDALTFLNRTEGNTNGFEAVSYNSILESAQ